MPEDARLLALIERYKPKPKRKADGGLVPALLKLAAFKPHVKLYRNNVGTLRDRFGNYVTYGLCNGSGDLIGYRSLIVTQAMVGTRIAQFVSIEAKSARGQLRESQRVWMEQCRAAGALAVCVRSVEDLDAALRNP